MFSFNRGDAKLLFSAANDGTIIAWGSGGAVHDRIPVSLNIYIKVFFYQLICMLFYKEINVTMRCKLIVFQ